MAAEVLNQPKLASLTPAQEAPVGNDRSFFNYKGSIPPGCLGLENFLDELSGLPLPVVPIPFPWNHSDIRVDFHHSFHPARRLIYGDDANVALRVSRGQDLPRWLHERYHKYFASSQLPSSRQAKFAACVLACAGAVPQEAVDFSDDFPVRRRVTAEEWERIGRTIRHEGAQRFDDGRYSRNRLGIFFANYALEQSFDVTLGEKTKDRFMQASSPERKKELGNLILKEAIEMALEPIRPLIIECREQGVVRRSPNLRDLVHDFFVRSRQPDYYVAIKQRLAAA